MTAADLAIDRPRDDTARPAGSRYPDSANPDLLSRIPADARTILDVGCGTGALGAAYRAVNPHARLLGIERDSNAAAIAGQRLDAVARVDVEQEPLPFELPTGVDCLIYGDVLQQLRDPWAVLRRQLEALNPGGAVLICVANAEHWSMAARLFRGNWSYESAGLLDVRHLRWFTLRNVVRGLSDVGLAVEAAHPRIFGAEQGQQFVQAFTPALQRLGIDAGEYVLRALPLQYVLSARRAGEVAANAAAVKPVPEFSDDMEARAKAASGPNLRLHTPVVSKDTPFVSRSLLSMTETVELERLKDTPFSRAVLAPADTIAMPPCYVMNPPSAPLSLSDTPHHQIFPRQMPCPEMWVARLDDVYYSPYAAPFLPDTRILINDCLPSESPDAVGWFRSEGDGIYRIPIDLDEAYCVDTGFFMGHPMSGDFGHFVGDCLTRMHAWQDCRKLFGDVKIILDDATQDTRFRDKLLAAAGVNAEDIVFAQGVVRCRKLLLASGALSVSRYASPTSAKLWQQIRDALAPSPAEGTERVYLSVSSQSAPKLTNEPELEDLFRNFGFVIVRLEGRPLEELISIISNAQLIAGPAGSAMFSLAFQTRLKSALILLPETFVHNSEWLFLAGTKCPVYYHFGLRDMPAGSPVSAADAWRVDVSRLAADVASWLWAGCETLSTAGRCISSRIEGRPAASSAEGSEPKVAARSARPLPSDVKEAIDNSQHGGIGAAAGAGGPVQGDSGGIRSGGGGCRWAFSAGAGIVTAADLAIDRRRDDLPGPTKAKYPENANPDLLSRIPTNALTILDVGCGTGALGAAYRALNPRARLLGIERDPDAAAIAEQRLDMVACVDVEQTALPFDLPTGVDCLIYGDVLQQLRDPWPVLRRQLDVLTPGGTVLICAANAEHWSMTARLLRGTWHYENTGLLDVRHLRWFTLRNIMRELTDAGLTVEEVHPRVFGAEQGQQFIQVLAPGLQRLGIDPGEYVPRAMPLQYILSARRSGGVAANAPAMELVKDPSLSVESEQAEAPVSEEAVAIGTEGSHPKAYDELPRFTHRVSIMACARWETPYITEWLLYHRAIGFDHVYLFCNDDDPTELYREVLPFLQGDDPFVTFRHFPFQGQQFQMYMHGLRQWKDDTQWLMFLDIDEFLCLRKDNNIKAFLDRVPSNWDCIQFNWLFFGNNGLIDRPAGSVLQTYTRRSTRLHKTCKTLTRTAAIDLARIDRKIYIWHGWEGALARNAFCCNVIGIDPADIPVEGCLIASEQDNANIIKRAVIHHYAFKSSKDFRLRYERGVAGDFSGQAFWNRVHERGEAEAELAPMNEVEDTTLKDYWSDYLRRGATALSLLPSTDYPNIALGKMAGQSSVSKWSKAPDRRADAAGAISGRLTGNYQFHTDFESSPWWMVDLTGRARIYEIRIFNRMDNPAMAERLRELAVEVSDDGEGWQIIATKAADVIVGGVDANPLRIALVGPITTRFVRVRLLQPGFLHLDQVEVYGEPVVSAAVSTNQMPSIAPCPNDMGSTLCDLAETTRTNPGRDSNDFTLDGEPSTVTPTMTLQSPAFHVACPEIVNPDLIPHSSRKAMEESWRRGTFEPRPLNIYQLTNAYVAHEALVFDSDLNVLAGSTYAFSEHEIAESAMALLQAVRSGRVASYPNPTVVVRARNPYNFGHYLLEMLPRAFIAQRLKSGQFLNFLIHRSSAPMLEVACQSLSLIGVGADQIIITGNEPAHFRRLIAVEGISRHGTYMSPFAVEALEAIAASVPRGTTKRLFVSRAAARRRLLNEDQLSQALSDAGYVTVDTTGMSLRDQITLFSGAERVIGVLGAAMTNIVFCRPGTKVAVLVPCEFPDTFFWFIAGHKKHHYVEVRCEQEQTGTPNSWDAGFVVREKEVDYLLSF